MSRRPFGFPGLAIIKIIAGARVLPDAVLVIQTDVEPDRRIERAMLVQAKPGELVVKNFRCLRVRKISIGNSPIGNRSRHPMDQLPDRTLAAGFVRIRSVRDVAVKIF